MKTKILLAFVFLVNASLFAQRNGSIQGKITDKDSNDGISFAGVVLKKDGQVVSSTVADVDGNYAFARLRPGIYTVKAKAVGYYGLTVLNLQVDSFMVKQDMGMEYDVILSVRPVIAAAAMPIKEEILPTNAQLLTPEEKAVVQMIPSVSVAEPSGTDRAVEPVKFAVTVYPNPVHDHATIEIASDSEVAAGIIRLYDLNGAEVRSYPFSGKTSSFERAGLAKGIYTYSITMADHSLATGKIVLQ